MLILHAYIGSDVLTLTNLRSGFALMTKAVLYSYSTGNSLGSIHFIWKIPEDGLEIQKQLGKYYRHCQVITPGP